MKYVCVYFKCILYTNKIKIIYQIILTRKSVLKDQKWPRTFLFVLFSNLKNFDVFWYFLIFFNVFWRPKKCSVLTFFDVNKFLTIFDVKSRFLIFFDIFWCFLTFFDVKKRIFTLFNVRRQFKFQWYTLYHLNETN